MIENPKLHSIGILYNPISGRGESLATANNLHALLKQQGYVPQIIQSQPKSRISLLFEPLQRLDALVALGGDGTLLNLLDILLELQLPVYLMPFGNECLFSKEFGMSKNPDLVLKSIKQNEVLQSDVAITKYGKFTTMLSIGLDSKVVQKISKSRTGTINKFDYLKAIIQLAFKHTPPEITLKVNGEKVVDNKKGFLNIANTKQYALGIPFSPNASPLSRMLMASFIPYETSLSFIWKNLCLLMSKKPNNYEVAQEKKFEISLSNEYPVQIDGDFLSNSSSLSVELDERKLQTLKQAV